jgi:hypothetical protein
MVGSDGSALMPVREGLLQGGMSVRTAWNVTQARQLATGANVVIVDVASESAAVAQFVVELAAREPAPLIVLIPGLPQHQKAFVDELAAVAVASGTSERGELLQTAATAIAPAG